MNVNSTSHKRTRTSIKVSTYTRTRLPTVSILQAPSSNRRWDTGDSRLRDSASAFESLYWPPLQFRVFAVLGMLRMRILPSPIFRHATALLSTGAAIARRNGLAHQLPREPSALFLSFSLCAILFCSLK